MIIDLSVPVKNSTSDPDSPRITYYSHHEGGNNLINGALRMILKSSPIRGSILLIVHRVHEVLRSLGLRIRSPFIHSDDFPGNKGLANEDIELDTHAGTHLDAPWHFGPRSGEKQALTIDQVPLEWCYSDGVVLDMRHKGAAEIISKDDVVRALKDISYTLKPCDIVLVMTGMDKYIESPKYFTAHPGMSSEATEYLVDSGIKIIGIDAWGFDRPAMSMLSDFLKTRDNTHIFPAHFVGRKKEYCHIEKLTNLESIPRPFGFKVACFPVKIERASAGWCRVVAITGEESI